MNPTPQGGSGRSRRLFTGVALATLVVAAAILISRPSNASPGHAGETAFSNESGALGVLGFTGSTVDSPFFAPLGTNGRSCASCHRPAQGWSITPADLRDRFEASDGLDPVFRTNDGSNCAGADISTSRKRRRAFSLLLAKGLIRVALDVPGRAEFDIVGVEDPYECNASLSVASMYRRPLPSANLKFVSAVMWDGRASAAGRDVREGLVAQVHDAVTGHFQGTRPPEAQVQAIVEFELGLYAAQVQSRAAGRLDVATAHGGPRDMARAPFCIGINDPLSMLPAMPGVCPSMSGGLDPFVFSLFRGWTDDESPQRRAIARGEAIFNTRQFVIDNVAGLNGGAEDPIRRPLLNGTCTVCHDTPHAGNHSVPMALNIGVAAATRRTPDLPLYTLRHRLTGETAQTTDPGRAMVTGRWKDIGKFKGPVLRALPARAPFFHDGSAATLADVIRFYDTRFQARFTEEEKADLLAFLQAL